MPYKDVAYGREHHKKYMRTWYAKNKKKHKKYVRAATLKQRERIRGLLAVFKAQGCCLCPEIEPCCLDAHHTNPNKKDFAIGDSLRMVYSLKKIEAELRKCVCVCRNCHAKIHAGLLRVVAKFGKAVVS